MITLDEKGMALNTELEELLKELRANFIVETKNERSKRQNLCSCFYFFRVGDSVIYLYANSGAMKKIRKMIKAARAIYLCIMWLILLPFVWLYDRLFGGWKK